MNIRPALESAYNNLMEARYFLELAQPYHTGVKIALDYQDHAKSEIVEIKNNITEGENDYDTNNQPSAAAECIDLYFPYPHDRADPEAIYNRFKDVCQHTGESGKKLS